MCLSICAMLISNVVTINLSNENLSLTVISSQTAQGEEGSGDHECFITYYSGWSEYHCSGTGTDCCVHSDCSDCF